MASSYLRIAEPCQEGWAAMTPTSGGRHCAACQKTVVDFSLKTDAEILAYFQQASSTQTCGRFRASQLERPLLPATLAQVAATQRWRAWLAAALAVWSLRAEAATGALTPVVPPTGSVHHPQRRPTPAAPTRQVARRWISGVVRNSDTRHVLPNVTVSVRGSSLRTKTDKHGRFRLRLPVRRRPHATYTLFVDLPDYGSRKVRVPLLARAAQTLNIGLRPLSYLDAPPELGSLQGGADFHVVEEIVEDMPLATSATDSKPAPILVPQKPRAFRRWLARLFRGQ